MIIRVASTQLKLRVQNRDIRLFSHQVTQTSRMRLQAPSLSSLLRDTHYSLSPVLLRAIRVSELLLSTRRELADNLYGDAWNFLIRRPASKGDFNCRAE